MYDVVIIGAGITGTMLCRKLSQYRLKLAVLEKANDIAEGATMANSAVIHVGYDPEDDTNKAELNVTANLGKNPQYFLIENWNCFFFIKAWIWFTRLRTVKPL